MAKKNNLIIVVIGIVVLALIIMGIVNYSLVGQAGKAEKKGGVASVCIDTDGAKNYAAAGKVTAGKTTSLDSCIDNSNLKEYYCNKNKIESVNYNCMSEGKACKNGACVNPDCDIEDTIDYSGVGQTKTYTMNGRDYEVTSIMIDNVKQTAKLSINGIVTKELAVGQSELLGDDTNIKIQEITSDSSAYHAKFCMKNPGTGPSLPKYYCEGGVVDTMKDGETRTYSIEGWDYEATAAFISEDRHTAKLSVNGVLTSELNVGESDNLGSGVTVKIFEVMTSQWNGIVTFCLKDELYPICDDTDPDAEYQNPAITSFGFLSKQDYCLNNRDIMNLYCGDGYIMKKDHFYTTVNKNEVHLQYMAYSATNRIATFKNLDVGYDVKVDIAADGIGELIVQGVPLQFRIQNIALSDSDIDKTINFKAIIGQTVTCANGCSNGACVP